MKTVAFFSLYIKLLFVSTKKIDLNFCKLTHIGTEYTGKLSVTETNVTCQYWHSATQKGASALLDNVFPDGSKVLAKNYCRNPDNNPNGPWCYTTQKKLLTDTCDVPLCRSSECRVSGTGMEYAGLIDKSVSGKKCSKWKKKHLIKGKTQEKLFKDRFFPNGSISQAGKTCRNPDGNISGPWCYTELEDSDFYIKELCDIPFCDDLETIMFSENQLSGQYFFFSKINETQTFNISFRLWNPSDWLLGEIFLFLSAYDIAADREDIERWKSGVEIILAHTGSGILSKEDELSKTPLILSGAKWTDIQITWLKIDNSTILIQVFEKSKLKPFALSEIIIENTIFEIESFRFFSLAGSPCFWKIPSSGEDCLVHTISQMNFTRFWLIKKTTLGKDIEVFVRAKRDANLVLRSAPMVFANQVQISIGDNGKIKVFIFAQNNHSRQLTETSWPNILNFWKWEYFKITILSDRLQVFWIRQGNTELVIEADHPNIEKVMWVSFASPWMSYWTIYCDPRGISDPPSPSPPECVSQEAEPFNGTLSVTKRGRQCIPWTDKTAIPEKYQNNDLFQPYGGKTACQNFCRNLNNSSKGAFCVVRDENSDSGFEIEYCYPRLCSLGDCKIAGTGNDYIGQLNFTRSKRECKKWTEIEDSIVNLNNFPDPTLEDAKNFCRNPSKSVTGTWCFTTDPKVPRDTCFIKDCDKPLECTVLTSGYVDESLIYILPTWRKYGLHFSLKAWNPDIYEGLIVKLLSMDRLKQYILLIGDEDNEKVKLFYKNLNLETPLVHKTLLHLIPTGKWSSYWLKPGLGKIELGYNGVANAFFEWTSSKETMSFEPMFINFGTIQGHWIGINFECNECLLTETSTLKVNTIYPINLWRDETVTTNLLLNLRGKGSALITLMWTPGFQKQLGIHILSNSSNIFIVKYGKEETFEILASYVVSSGMSEHEWSEYIISFTENSLTVHKDSINLFEWSSPFPLFFYWFSVSGEGGPVTWSANCPAADIDGEPRDGSWGTWGPWSCSVTCGKGEGQIKRSCDDPPPNVFGKECKGSPIYHGPCNDFPCGEISPRTNNIIRQYLSSQHKSLEVDVTERVVLKCNAKAIALITAEVSEMNITWTHNGFPYSRTKFHMDENYSLVIPRAQEKHNGIYLCMAYQDPESVPSKVVLEVISLVVIKPKPTKKIRKGRSLTLKCNGLALSYVYADLSQRWELNGTVWKDYGLGALQTFTVDKLENITDSHAGVWTCVVIQEDYKFKWKTNWIYLKVKRAPSFWSNLMEDVATAPLFGNLGSERNAMILFFTLIGLLLAIILGITVFLAKSLKK